MSLIEWPKEPTKGKRENVPAPTPPLEMHKNKYRFGIKMKDLVKIFLKRNNYLLKDMEYSRIPFPCPRDLVEQYVSPDCWVSHLNQPADPCQCLL